MFNVALTLTTATAAGGGPTEENNGLLSSDEPLLDRNRLRRHSALDLSSASAYRIAGDTNSLNERHVKDFQEKDATYDSSSISLGQLTPPPYPTPTPPPAETPPPSPPPVATAPPSLRPVVPPSPTPQSRTVALSSLLTPLSSEPSYSPSSVPPTAVISSAVKRACAVAKDGSFGTTKASSHTQQDVEYNFEVQVKDDFPSIDIQLDIIPPLELAIGDMLLLVMFPECGSADTIATRRRLSLLPGSVVGLSTKPVDNALGEGECLFYHACCPFFPRKAQSFRIDPFLTCVMNIFPNNSLSYFYRDIETCHTFRGNCKVVKGGLTLFVVEDEAEGFHTTFSHESSDEEKLALETIGSAMANGELNYVNKNIISMNLIQNNPVRAKVKVAPRNFKKELGEQRNNYQLFAFIFFFSLAFTGFLAVMRQSCSAKKRDQNETR